MTPALPVSDPSPGDHLHRATAGSVAEVAAVFLRLGCMSFGGPIAHLGYLRAELVEKRRWIDDAQLGDLVALCQFLPGPASSQVVFAMGMQRAGLPGALLASACFTLPSALLMVGFAYGVATVGNLQGAGWLHGLKLAAVVVVAQAVWGMGKKLCTDRARVSLCLAAAAIVLAFPSALAQLGVIAGAGVVGLRLYRNDLTPAPSPTRAGGWRGHAVAGSALLVFLVLLVVLPALSSATGSRAIAELDSFYRSGSLVFGGGHVVLPLLRAEVVPRGWLTDEQFLAGYGAAQALPGPMFAFAAYLGSAMNPGDRSWLGGIWCLLAIFLPAWLLIGGALPFWHRLRAKRWAQAALAGANASVVGILLAALYNPVFTEGVRGGADAVAALVGFGLLEHWRAPPWLVVVGMAAAGQWLLPA
ncbi:Chromate transport protein ChrA [Vulgatibacter incomptus]|uniref:Chromate transport protein ChrA n=2 Tax=Vulgatibacter incomptus TaxID=1391653 RepID=A0A0K1PGB1_9BACT|nr:Chromate transport protein ChrA [Vulgatibacter incomptus]